jgi:hypothetical protein
VRFAAARNNAPRSTRTRALLQARRRRRQHSVGLRERLQPLRARPDERVGAQRNADRPRRAKGPRAVQLVGGELASLLAVAELSG